MIAMEYEIHCYECNQNSTNESYFGIKLPLWSWDAVKQINKWVLVA